MKELPADNELIVKLQKGDVKAFDLVYEKYAGRHHGFILKYLKSTGETEQQIDYNSILEQISLLIAKLPEKQRTNFLVRLFSHGHNNQELRNYLMEDWNNTPATADSSETELRRLPDRIHHIIRNNENQKRWYNVKIVLADPDPEKYSFRATFEDDSLEEVLRLLSMTSPIGYKISPRIYKSDGTFEKEVITLFKKITKTKKKLIMEKI